MLSLESPVLFRLSLVLLNSLQIPVIGLLEAFELCNGRIEVELRVFKLRNERLMLAA